jgi:hypothetical protein
MSGSTFHIFHLYTLWAPLWSSGTWGQAASYFCCVTLIYGQIWRPKFLCGKAQYCKQWRKGVEQKRRCGICATVCVCVCVCVHLIMLHIYLNSLRWLGVLCYLKPLIKNVNRAPFVWCYIHTAYGYKKRKVRWHSFVGLFISTHFRQLYAGAALHSPSLCNKMWTDICFH